MKRLPRLSLFPTKKGVVLVMALWLIMIMAIFGIGLARLSWSSYRYVRFRTNKFLSAQAINAIVAMSKLDRMLDETTSYDILSELPMDAEYESDNIKVVYSVIDEERKINVSKAPNSKFLKNLPGMDDDKAIAIVNSSLRPFRLKEELLLIDEIEEEDYHEMKDSITIYGNGRVNINTCSEETLEALGTKENLIKHIMEFRKGVDDELNTEDDGIFETKSGIMDTLKANAYLSLSEEQSLVTLLSMDILDVESDNYEIKAEVFAQNRLVGKYSIIFGRKEKQKENRYYIKRWEQH